MRIAAQNFNVAPLPDDALFEALVRILRPEALTYRQRRALEMRRAGMGYDDIGRTFNVTYRRALELETEALIAHSEFYIRESNRVLRLKGVVHELMPAPVVPVGMHRRSPGARPVRSRGSRRCGSGSRASPDDDEGESSKPPGSRLGRRGHDNRIGGQR